MTVLEKREHQTRIFTNSLKQDKAYFKDFNKKFEGIVEAESQDEMTIQSEVGDAT